MKQRDHSTTNTRKITQADNKAIANMVDRLFTAKLALESNPKHTQIVSKIDTLITTGANFYLQDVTPSIVDAWLKESNAVLSQITITSVIKRRSA